MSHIPDAVSILCFGAEWRKGTLRLLRKKMQLFSLGESYELRPLQWRLMAYNSSVFLVGHKRLAPDCKASEVLQVMGCSSEFSPPAASCLGVDVELFFCVQHRATHDFLCADSSLLRDEWVATIKSALAYHPMSRSRSMHKMEASSVARHLGNPPERQRFHRGLQTGSVRVRGESKVHPDMGQVFSHTRPASVSYYHADEGLDLASSYPRSATKNWKAILQENYDDTVMYPAFDDAMDVSDDDYQHITESADQSKYRRMTRQPPGPLALYTNDKPASQQPRISVTPSNRGDDYLDHMVMKESTQRMPFNPPRSARSLSPRLKVTLSPPEKVGSGTAGTATPDRFAIPTDWEDDSTPPPLPPRLKPLVENKAAVKPEEEFVHNYMDMFGDDKKDAQTSLEKEDTYEVIGEDLQGMALDPPTPPRSLSPRSEKQASITAGTPTPDRYADPTDATDGSTPPPLPPKPKPMVQKKTAVEEEEKEVEESYLEVIEDDTEDEQKILDAEGLHVEPPTDDTYDTAIDHGNLEQMCNPEIPSLEEYVRSFRSDQFESGVSVTIAKSRLSRDTITLVCIGSNYICVAALPNKDLHANLHTSDIILKVNSQVLTSVNFCYDLFESTDQDTIQLLVKRAPYGTMSHVIVPPDRCLEALGLEFGNKDKGCEVTHIEKGGLIEKSGNPNRLQAASIIMAGQHVNWGITEINRVPVSLTLSANEMKAYIQDVEGDELALLFLPMDLVDFFLAATTAANDCCTTTYLDTIECDDHAYEEVA